MVGGYGRGNRYRWWYRATGLPGWLRCPPWHWHPFWYPEIPAEEELQMLEEEKRMLEEELKEIERRIEEVKKEIKEVK